MESFIQQKPSAAQGAESEKGRRPSSPPPLNEGICGAAGRTQLPGPNACQAPSSCLFDFPKRLALFDFMKSLGCKFKRGCPNPLSDNEHLLSLAIAKYMELFGCLPTQHALDSQRFSSLSRPINLIYGGFEGMRRAYGEGRIPYTPSGLSPAEHTEAPQEAATNMEGGSSTPAPPSPPAKLTDENKIAEMAKYLGGLRRWFAAGADNPCMHNRGLVEFALRKYLRIFGSLPDYPGLKSQRLLPIYDAIRATYGGLREMREASFQGAFSMDKPCPDIPELEEYRKEKLPSKALVKKNAPRKAPAQKQYGQKPGKPIPSGSRMLGLDYCGYPLAQIRMAKEFISAHSERLEKKGGFAREEVFFSLTLKGPRILVNADPAERRLFFMERDIPALMFIAAMELGSKELVETEIMELARDFKLVQNKNQQWARTKIWAAKRFYQEGLEPKCLRTFDTERFSPKSIELMHGMFRNQKKFELQMEL